MKSPATNTAPTGDSLLREPMSALPVRSSWAIWNVTILTTLVQVALDFLSVFAALLIANAVYRLFQLGTRVSYPLDLYLLTSATVAAAYPLRRITFSAEPTNVSTSRS